MKILIFLFLLINYSLIQCKILNYQQNEDNNQILNVNDIKIAQTHIIPIEGKSWVIKNQKYTLKVIPNRDSLIIAKFDDANGNYTINVYDGANQLIGSKFMNLPSQFPKNEDNNFGPKYSNVQYHSILIPGNWIKKNMVIQFQLTSNETIKSNTFKVNVGIERNLFIQTLPVYLFGANDSNTTPFDTVKNVDSGTISELTQKYPVATIRISNHQIQKLMWDYLIVKPTSNLTARVLKNANQSKGQEVVINFIEVLKGIKSANGEITSADLMYAPILSLNKDGKFYSYGYGGWSGIGQGVGTGDSFYRGIFIHEEGHALSLWHSSEAYSVTGKFTNSRGNLKDSEWAYDSNNNEFLSIYIPPSADSYSNCNKTHEVTDDGKYCYKQSVMQSGAGDQSSKYRFSIFADIEMCMIQTFFENAIYYIKDSNKYQKYNSTIEEFYDYRPTTKSDGLYSLDDGTPIERDVDVYTIIFTYSTAGTNEVSQFYPIIKTRGNLIRYFDPSNKTTLSDIMPLTNAPLHSYCYQSGCDYTLRVTYKDNSSKSILVSQGKRKWGYPKSTVYIKDINNPLSEDSFITGVYNVKADKELLKIELLDTPFGFNGLPTNPTVLISKSF